MNTQTTSTLNNKRRRAGIKTASVLALLGILATTNPATAWEAGLAFGATSQSFSTDSTRFFSGSNTIAATSLRASATVSEQIFAELEWLWARSERGRTSLSGGGYLAQLDNDALTASGRYRWQVASWLEPFARAGAGATRHVVNLSGNTGGLYDGKAWAPHLLVGGGVDLEVSREALWRKRDQPLDTTFGVTFEVGWRHVFGRDLVLERTDAVQPALATGDLQLGTLTMSGLTWRLAMIVRI